MSQPPEIRYLILDDEPIAQRIIKDYASRLPFLVCAGQCYNPLQAIEVLRAQQVDLIFLDIHMPEMNGFEFLKTLISPPQIVVTTAYEAYALEGYALNVVDYLLKPITEARFLQAMQKVRPKAVDVPRNSGAPTEEKILVKGDKTHHYIAVKDMTHVEAFGNYCLVHVGSQTILTPQKISSLAESWRCLGFLRVHKSHLVSKNFIEAISAKSLTVDGKEIPIGMAYKRELYQQLGLT